MTKFQYVPECFADTEFVKVLFLDGKYHANADFDNHAFGISQVAQVLKKQDVIGYTNIGFIDNDKKNVPPYFENFKLIAECESVAFKKHPEGNDYIFVLKPAIEKFLIGQMNEIGKLPSNYSLPDDFKAFRKQLKSIQIKHSQAYLEMLQELRQQRPSGIAFILDHVDSLRKSAI